MPWIPLRDTPHSGSAMSWCPPESHAKLLINASDTRQVYDLNCSPSAHRNTCLTVTKKFIRVQTTENWNWHEEWMLIGVLRKIHRKQSSIDSLHFQTSLRKRKLELKMLLILTHL